MTKKDDNQGQGKKLSSIQFDQDGHDSSLNKSMEKKDFDFADEFRLFSDQALLGIVILQDGLVKYANQSVAEIMEFSIDEMKSWAPNEFAILIHPDDVEFAMEQARKKQAGEKDVVIQYSYRIITKNKQVKWVDQYSRTINYKGAFADFVTIVDITERKKAEEALKQSELRYREMFSAIMEGVGIVDKDEIVQFCNPAFAKIFEEDSVDNLLGKSLYDYIPDYQKNYLDSISEKRRRNISSRYEIEIKTAKGNIRTIRVSASPRFDESGEYIGAFGAIIDLTVRRRAEEALEKAHQELAEQFEKRTKELEEANLRKKALFDLYTIFELSRNFNAMLDYQSLLDSFILAALGRVGSARAGLFLPPKPGFEEFHLIKSGGGLSFSKDRVVIRRDSTFNRYIANLNRPVKITEVTDKFELSKDLDFVQFFPNGLVVPLVFQTKLRGILILSEKESKQPYHDNDIEFLSILASQTAVSIENSLLYESEREALNKLQKTQKLLLHSERSAALGDLSAKIAHEINNPLGIIKNYLSLTTRNIDSPEKSLNYTKIIRQEIDRIAIIVKQLLNFHRPAAVRLEKVNPDKIIAEILSLMDRQLSNAGITVVCQLDEKIPDIVAWPDGLKQVFINLIVNSMDAMEDGGGMVINIKKTEHTVIFSFEDTGTGIEPEHIPHIFDPYYTTKATTGGSGLGLSVCYNIIKNHNGSISYTNTEQGGCFIIELPIEHKGSRYDWQI